MGAVPRRCRHVSTDLQSGGFVDIARETVELALHELVARHRRLGILELSGRVHWEGDLEESRAGRV
jgi:Arc/MetJ family transcription regulator